MLLTTSKKGTQVSPLNKSNIELYSYKEETADILQASNSKRPATSVDTFLKPRTPHEHYDDMLMMQALEPETPK